MNAPVKPPIRREADAHRRQARRDRRRRRGLQPLHERGGRHRAGGAARARARGVPDGQGLQGDADPLRAPAHPAAHGRDPARPHGGVRAPDHGRIGPVLEGLALRGEPRLRRLVLRRPAHHQGRRRDLRLRHLAERQAAQDLHDAHAAARRDLGDHAVQSPAQHGQPQARAGDRHQQPRRPEADRADAAYRARPRRRALRGRAAARDAVGRDRQPLDHGRRHDHRPGRRPHHLHGLGAGSANTSPRRPATGASCSSSAATIR